MGTIAGGSAANSFLLVESTTGSGTSDYVAWRTAAQVERMRLFTGGALSLGTTSAGTAIDTGLSASYDPIFTVYNPTAIYPGTILLATQNTTNAGAEMGRIHFMNGTNRVAGILVGADSAANNDAFFTISTMNTGAFAEAFRLSSDGTTRLSGSGYTSNGTVSTSGGNGTLTTASDERLKRIQGPYEPGLAEVLKIKPIRYKWLPDIREAGVTPEQVYAGFSAQNVRDALGDLAVGQRLDGILSLQDRAILGALVNAVTELAAKNDALEARLAALEGKK